MQIQVLGAGCASCKKLYEITTEIVEELNLDTKVDYITDVSKIVEMGIMQSPVLTVNGKAAMIGFVPNKEKIKDAIIKALE
jgi:small redox-active disulfide protein 2